MNLFEKFWAMLFYPQRQDNGYNMKRIPASYELDEDDIRRAILLYMDQDHEDNEVMKEDIIFHVTTVQLPYPPGAPRGGMADPVLKKVISATIKKSE